MLAISRIFSTIMILFVILRYSSTIKLNRHHHNDHNHHSLRGGDIQTVDSGRYQNETLLIIKNLKRNHQRRKHHTLFRGYNNLRNRNGVKSSITFRYFKNGEQAYGLTDEPSLRSIKRPKCNSMDKHAFILHGWKQSCETIWVQKLIERLTYHRGGCIVCADYSQLAQWSYPYLYRSFKAISGAIAENILALIDKGFDPKNGYMFGFSFGGQLATYVGRSLGQKNLLKSIDTCDMAGPFFDFITDVDHRSAAEHVQCLHSSWDKGTRIYTCHKNIRLGKCGFHQPAHVSQTNYSSHGLCVEIYLNTFDYPFYALRKHPRWCPSNQAKINGFQKVTFGYSENLNADISGEYFVPTSLNYPYNLSKREIQELELNS